MMKKIDSELKYKKIIFDRLKMEILHVILIYINYKNKFYIKNYIIFLKIIN